MVYYLKNELGDIEYFTRLYRAKQVAAMWSNCSKYLAIDCYEGNKPGRGGAFKYQLYTKNFTKWTKINNWKDSV